MAALRFGAQMSTELMEVQARGMLREALEEAERAMMPTRELALTWRRQKQALLASYRAPRPQSYGGGYGGGLAGHVRPRGSSSHEEGSASSSGVGSPMGSKQKHI